MEDSGDDTPPNARQQVDISVIFKDAGGGLIFANELDKGDETPRENIPAKTIAVAKAAGIFDKNGKFTRAIDVKQNGDQLLVYMSNNDMRIVNLTKRGGAKNHRKSKKRIHRKRRRTMNKK